MTSPAAIPETSGGVELIAHLGVIVRGPGGPGLVRSGGRVCRRLCWQGEIVTEVFFAKWGRDEIVFRRRLSFVQNVLVKVKGER